MSANEIFKNLPKSHKLFEQKLQESIHFAIYFSDWNEILQWQVGLIANIKLDFV